MEKITIALQHPEWLNDLIDATRQTHEAAQKLKVELENLNHITDRIQKD